MTTTITPDERPKGESLPHPRKPSAGFSQGALSRIPSGVMGEPTLPDRPKLLVRDDTTEQDQAPLFARTPFERTSLPPSDRVGMVLAGRFKLLSVIGQGPLGTVYEAEDLELDAFVAIKVLARELCDSPATMERVRRQISKARGVIHPNVCRIFDINRHEDRHFLVMEYVPGHTLADEIRIGMSAETARRRFLQILDALQAIHAAGLVHGAVSPLHIRVRADGVLKITSTGLSCDLLSGTGLHSADHDCPSPEQRDGHHATVRSDVYAVGQIGLSLVKQARNPAELPILTQLAERSTDPDPSKRFASIIAMLEEFDHLSQATRGALSPLPVQTQVATALPEPEISTGDVPLATIGLVLMGISAGLRRIWRVAIPLPVVGLGIMLFLFANEAKHALTISSGSGARSFFGILSGGSADAGDAKAVRALEKPKAPRRTVERHTRGSAGATTSYGTSLAQPTGWAPMDDGAPADDLDESDTGRKTRIAPTPLTPTTPRPGPAEAYGLSDRYGVAPPSSSPIGAGDLGFRPSY